MSETFEYKLLTQVNTTARRIWEVISNVFVNPDNTITYIRTIQLYNSHTEAVNVKLYKVAHSGTAPPVLGTASTLNQFFGTNVVGETNMEAGDTILIEFAIPGMILEEYNDSIQAIASEGNVVTIEITGAQETTS